MSPPVTGNPALWRRMVSWFAGDARIPTTRMDCSTVNATVRLAISWMSLRVSVRPADCLKTAQWSAGVAKVNSITDSATHLPESTRACPREMLTHAQFVMTVMWIAGDVIPALRIIRLTHNAWPRRNRLYRSMGAHTGLVVFARTEACDAGRPRTSVVGSWEQAPSRRSPWRAVGFARSPSRVQRSVQDTMTPNCQNSTLKLVLIAFESAVTSFWAWSRLAN